MKKHQLDHVLRAAGRITGKKSFVIVGSQSLHGKYPDLPDEILSSAEADLLAVRSDRTEWLNVIGQDSPFHQEFGYYADPVEEGTAILPSGWKGRLVNLPPGDKEGVRGLCLDPHDLAISKYIAGRDKDRLFNRELVRRRLLDRARLLALIDETPVADPIRTRVRVSIAEDFSRERQG
jgi:hypothetical protein